MSPSWGYAPIHRPLRVLPIGACLDALSAVGDVRAYDAVAPIVRTNGIKGAVDLVRRAVAADPDVIVLGRGVTPLVSFLLRVIGQRVVVGPAGHLGALALAAGRPGAGLGDGPRVSVVATVLDERAGIDDLVGEVAAQLAPGDEFIVADGGSTDGTLERLEAWAARLESLRVLSTPGVNISGGRNAAVGMASASVIVCADAGCRPAPGWLEAMRLPFAEVELGLGLVAGVPWVEADSALQAAQAAACYPDPGEAARPGLAVRAYTKVFGTGFTPAVPFARCLAFTKDAWASAGGFPEALGWVEDGAFGRAVARREAFGLVTDARVVWTQRASLRSTFSMYRRYGFGAFQSGDRVFVVRDGVRIAAYLGAMGAVVGGRRSVRAVLAVAAIAYLSLPLLRLRRRGQLAAAALVPVALATKDLGKVVGEFEALFQRGRR